VRPRIEEERLAWLEDELFWKQMEFPAGVFPKGIFLESQFEWLSRHFLTRCLGGYFQSNQEKQRRNTIEKFSNSK